MTPKQTSLYWRLWQAARVEMHWRMIKGRLQIERSQLNEEGSRVVEAATARAKREHRAPTLDDLRHGVHIVALGHDCSSKEIKPRDEFDRVKALLGLLAKPESLEAITEWQDCRKRGTLRRLAHAIRNVPPEYVESICVDRFGTRDWRNLSDQDQHRLVMILKNRNPEHAEA